MEEKHKMREDILFVNGLSEAILDSLSYRTQLGRSLKNNIHYFEKADVLREMLDMTNWLYEHEILSEIALDYRIKSMQSISNKYDRYYPDRQMRQVFNDILGFRAFCDSYKQVLALKSDIFRIVDMSSGKNNDDGYRGVHLYYQKDNFHYPIEIQYNTLYDRQLNNWLHDYVYKKDYPNNVGILLREKYESGEIHDEDSFMEVLKCVTS
jgi:putative GTP pyrophosphokinase